MDKGIVAALGYARALPDFLGVGGMYWMVAQAIMLPLGYLVGEKREDLRTWLFPRVQKMPSLGYASLVAVIVLCSGGVVHDRALVGEELKSGGWDLDLWLPLTLPLGVNVAADNGEIHGFPELFLESCVVAMVL